MKSVDETTDPEKDLSEIVSCIMFCVEKCAPIKIFRLRNLRNIKKRRQQSWVTNREKSLISQKEMDQRTKHDKQKSTQECKK